MSIDEKIKRWVQPLKTTIAGIEIRDVHLERNTPLILDSKVLHEAYVTSNQKKRGTTNEQG
jgi:hypothetical protein